MSINTDKAYIFGLVIGGGVFGNAEDAFYISLPYKQWGSYEKNPQRAAQIINDIMRVINPMFRNIYGINTCYETRPSGNWHILCDGDLADLRNDLRSYGVECEGDLRTNVSISGIVNDLADDFVKKRFIAGLADTIGSTNKNHRRFTPSVQILSFELKGFNFSFICELCKLLYSIGCLPDQILWNHPNFHAANNCYYSAWRKGHKLRVQLDQYDKFGAFAFKTKAEASKENRKLQQHINSAVECPDKEVRATVSCVHPAEHDNQLPDFIRGGHYLHNRHVCAVLSCEHAPYGKIKELFNQAGELINPFPVICKDSYQRIEEIINTDPLLANRNYTKSDVSVMQYYLTYQSNSNTLLYGNNINTGYPITEILQAIAYVVADAWELNGTRTKGNYINLIERYISKDLDLNVEMRMPDLLTPLIISGNEKSVLIGARNPGVYEKLVSVSYDNAYKLLVRKITEADLQ